MEKRDTSSSVKTYPVGIVYITICLHPSKLGMMYVGSHACNNPTYLGSGGILQHYIRKFGAHYFKRYTISEYYNVTRDDLIAHEDLWIDALNATNSSLFWNQKSRASGGYVIKDSVVHSEKTKFGMQKNGAKEKISQNARLEHNILRSINKLRNITPTQRQKAMDARRSNGVWYDNICARNKSMAQDINWQIAQKQGLRQRDRFVITPIGIFANAVDAGKAFIVSNVSILHKVYNINEPEWAFSDDKDVITIDPLLLSEEQKNNFCKQYFSKIERVAHNRKAVTVQGVIYPSKTAARKELKWSQERLENYLKKEQNNDI